jgi:prepilin-type N-terminal cleavage/methylation domain-containing protein
MARRFQRKNIDAKLSGFSLLEVVVALAVLAVSFTSLVLVQARATRMAQRANNLSVATALARMQLLECKSKVEKNISAMSDFSLDGNFALLGHADFTYECHAPKFSMHSPSDSAVETGLKKNALKKGNNQDLGASNQIVSPFISMITDSLGNAIRELTVIIRWKDNTVEDEIRVVTHVVDLAPISVLARTIGQGIENSPKGPKKKEPNKVPKEDREKGP